MRKIEKYLGEVFISMIFCALGLSVTAKTTVSNLKCEYHFNPIGIDIVQPRLSWQIASDQNGMMQSAYEIRVADSEANLSNPKKALWQSGKVNSSQSVNVVYDGAAPKSMQRLYWQVRIWDQQGKASGWSTPAFWEMGLLTPNDWVASWIIAGFEKDNSASRPSQYYRKPFNLSKKVASARVYVTSLGLYELYVNGKKVGDELFTPGWTSYKKRVQYQTYDVTSLLGQNNVIGAILGDGWFRGNIGFSGQRGFYGDKIALLAQLQINYTDGTSETVVTNSDWKVANGPILESDIYNGETYDARLEMEGWNQPGFNESKWVNAEEYNHPKNILVAPQGVPVKAVQELKALKVFKTPKGETVLDMGQNMVGLIRLKVKGNRGDKVVLKYAEVLDKAGNFYTDNLRSAKCTDVYCLKGNGEEVYQPRFTFHGFRYVQVEGIDNITPDQVTGIVIHSDMAPTGTFSCSEPLINQLQHNIQWGQKGNFLDVPTDCPQRDERLGWTGDAQVFSMTAAFNFDVAAFYTKWLKDLIADQLPTGSIPHVIPDVLGGPGGSTAWADVAVVVPYTVYLAYGDKRILEDQYNSMKAFVEFMRARAGEDYIWTGDFHFGDWLAFASNRSDYTGATTEKDLIATAHYRYTTGLFSKIASILGRNEDAAKYAELSEKVKAAFQKEFVTPNGRLVSHTQTAYSLALAFDLLPDNLRQNAADFLAADVKSFGHLTTGFVGTPLLCKTLAATGHGDLAFMLLNRKDYPSWLYPVLQGATTIWERWDGQKPDGSFQDVGMNSFNHYAYGAIGEWLYRYVAGIDIDPEQPGYKHILLQPHPGGGLTNAAAELKTLYGTVKSSWKTDGGKMSYEVSVPANTTATVTLPLASTDQLSLNEVLISSVKGVSFKQGNDYTTVQLGSGNYRFTYNADFSTNK